MKEITLRVKGDTRDVDAKINRLAKSIETLTGKPKRSGSLGAQFFGVDARQLQDFLRVSKQLNQTIVENAKQASRQRQQLDTIDARHAARMAEIAARGRITAENNAARSIEAAKRREFSEYQRIEREKTKLAQAEIKKRNSFSGSFKGGFLGGALGSMLPGFNEVSQVATEGLRLNASLDKLVRFTATLDKNFQTPVALKKFTDDIKQLSREIPQSAESIAKASFTVKSAFNDLTEPEVIEFLRQFGIAATGSNADIAEHTEKVAALAKQYGITAKELPQFNAMIASSFGQALASDSQVAEGFNKLIVSAKLAKIPLNDLIAAMSTMQSTSSDAAGNTNNLLNVIAKLGDAKYIEGLKEVFNIDRYKNNGKELKTLNEIINELAKSLEGLSDAEKLQKLNKVFKDLQANQGAASLINGIKAYNEQLRNGADIDAFQRKNELMLNAVESRWTKFWNGIKSDQSGTGAAITDFFLTAFDSTTVMGAIAIFFNNIGGAILQGLVAVAQKINSFFLGIGEGIASLFVGEESMAKIKANNQKLVDFTNDLYNGIGNITESNNRSILERQRKSWQEIADATADPQTKATALKNVTDLNNSIRTSVEGSQLKLYESYKGLADAALKGLASTNEQTKSQARLQVQSLIKTITDAAANPQFKDVSGDMAALAKRLTDALAGGIEQNKPAVTAAVNDLVKTDQAAAQAKTSGFQVGQNLGGGLLQGMNSKLGEIRALSMLMGKTAEQGLNTQLVIKSPSKITTIIGEFFGEGFARGIENKISRAKNSAKKLADETIKAFKDAVKEFNKLAGASPEVVQGIQATTRVKDAVESQQEIVKLRKELGINLNSPLPNDVAGTESERRYLEQRKKETEDFKQSLDDLSKGFEDLQKSIDESNKAFTERLQGMENSGAMDLLNLQEQIQLTGVLDERQREQIENYYEVERLRQEMSNDGYGQAQIDEAESLLEIQQAQRAELNQILRVRRQVAEADSFGKELGEQLRDLQNGGRELSTYEQTLERINRDLQEISPAQRDYLLNIAKQIDAQKDFNRHYEETYDLIRNTFDVLTDSGLSFGDKMKQIFGSIADRFRQMMIDMATQWLTSKLFKAGGGSGGGWLGGLLNIFGGGSGGIGGTPNWNPSAGSAGGSLGAESFTANGIRQFINFGGGSTSATGMHEAAHAGSIRNGKFTLANGMALGAMGLSLIGGLIGNNRVGNTMSAAGTGMSLGMALGSVVPGLGTVIGGAIGGIGGAIVGLFMGDKKRKVDKKENMPKLQQGFRDSIKGFHDLIADVTALRTDPDGAMAQGRELRQAIASGFQIDFQSKKYRKIAQQQIKQQLAAIDAVPNGLMEQLKRAVDIAKAAGDRTRRILPEFADGGAVSQFFTRNFAGLVPGMYDRLDDKLIRVSGNEVVLTPKQWQPIAPYLAAAKVPGFADGGRVRSIASNGDTAAPPVVNIYLQGDIPSDWIKKVSVEGLKGEAGHNAVVNILKKADSNRELEDIKRPRR